MYLPFTFINEGFLSIKNFANGIYSWRELETINLKERKEVSILSQISKNYQSHCGI